MYHGKMTAHIYNIWSLTYRTHSLVFVRHLLCVLFGYNASSYAFSIIVSYHFYLSKSSARPSDLNVAIEKGTIIGIQGGCSQDTGRIQSGYREDTVRIQPGYREDTVRIQGGYSQDTGRIQSGYREDTVRIQWCDGGDGICDNQILLIAQ